MKTSTAIDPDDFERLLSRNLKLPLFGGLFGAVVFVGLILFLLNTIGWVEHTDRVTRAASELQRQSIDMETGMRGFLITSDESFLEPYQNALTRIKSDTAALRELVSDNRQQVERIDRIAAIQASWNDFAKEVIDTHRTGQDGQTEVRVGRGKRLMDSMRAEFTAFMETEQALRFQRNNDANSTAWWVVGLFLLFTLSFTGLVAYFGRRQLVRLSESYDVVLKEQSDHADRLAHEAWLRGAQTELVGELVGELSAPDMGRKILAFFSRHLGTSVGAIYVRERHGPLRRAASYGFSSAAEATPQVFSPTESLIGQSAAERRRMLIDPVDADYLKVNSGLGDMAPKSVLLLPVASSGMVNGVVELGLPGALDERGSQLVDLVAALEWDARRQSPDPGRLAAVVATYERLAGEMPARLCAQAGSQAPGSTALGARRATKDRTGTGRRRQRSPISAARRFVGQASLYRGVGSAGGRGFFFHSGFF